MDAAPSPPSKDKHTRRWVWLGVLAVAAAATGWAWQTVRKVRLHGQVEDVLCMARELSAAADQYFLENGVSTVAFENIVGSSNYLKAIEHIAGESYPTVYTKGVTITVRGVAGSATVTYEP